MSLNRTFVPIALAAALGGCSLLGGAKPPATLFTITTSAPDPQQITRTAAAGQAVTVGLPVIEKSLRTPRIAVDLGATQVQYVKGVQLVDYPDRLFQQLLSETIRRTTNRVVLDPKQSTLDPGVHISGELQRFGYDANTGQVVVQYDAAMSTEGGARIDTRRFTASAPADGTNKTVPQALNDAANQVAIQVAQWIGG